MSNLITQYGFVPFGIGAGDEGPTPIEYEVATAASFDINGGASNVAIRKGDPLTLLNTGTVTLCDGSEGASGGVKLFGICAGIVRYWDAVQGRMTTTNALPSDVSWGTNHAKASRVLVWPVDVYKYWTVLTDASMTDYAGATLLIGTFMDHVLTGATDNGAATPLLDVGTTGTSNGQWRLTALSGSLNNQDYASAYIRCVVTPNSAEVITAI